MEFPFFTLQLSKRLFYTSGLRCGKFQLNLPQYNFHTSNVQGKFNDNHNVWFCTIPTVGFISLNTKLSIKYLIFNADFQFHFFANEGIRIVSLMKEIIYDTPHEIDFFFLSRTQAFTTQSFGCNVYVMVNSTIGKIIKYVVRMNCIHFKSV